MSTWDDKRHPRDRKTGEFVELAGTEQADTLSPAGTEEYATDERPESAADTTRFSYFRRARERMRDRARELLSRGYLPASSTEATVDPRSREGIDEFWRSHYVSAEQADLTHTGGAYEVMPDDYTPSMGAGRALSGHRRAHRIGYSNSEVAVRMPSVTAIRRFSAEKRGRTFDVPVDATYPGGSVSGYVRVTNNGPGMWSVEGLGMDPEAKAYVSESVQALLEARSVTMALNQIPDMLARRAERLRSAGVGQREVVASDWVRSAGYNRASGDMVVNLNGRTYGYRGVPAEVYQRLTEPGVEDGYSAGKVYNALIKRKHDSFAVDQCPTCQRYFESGRAHRCPSQHKARVGARTGYQNAVRTRLVHVAGAA
ncbi:KTSC domain-containing protein [Microbacterium enclense]|uniref:KTSC domain-containing protein n=1 Tax=Microbacterium enclense TaxID=993073 RepID=UPI003F7DF9D4